MKEDEWSRRANPKESDRERVFWGRYWEALEAERIENRRRIWYEWAVRRFIRFVAPRRLQECDRKDVTEWLRLMAHQSGAEAWQVALADRALKVLFQRVLKLGWSGEWSVGQWVFAAGKSLVNPWSDRVRRHHVHEALLERAISAAHRGRDRTSVLLLTCCVRVLPAIF